MSSFPFDSHWNVFTAPTLVVVIVKMKLESVREKHGWLTNSYQFGFVLTVWFYILSFLRIYLCAKAGTFIVRKGVKNWRKKQISNFIKRGIWIAAAHTYPQPWVNGRNKLQHRKPLASSIQYYYISWMGGGARSCWSNVASVKVIYKKSRAIDACISAKNTTLILHFVCVDILFRPHLLFSFFFHKERLSELEN